ncbi:arylsulfatase [Microbacterium esteraromaticum]|uniref:arylsulfatase n=1 Tax=Microbacterium esteraromaticum TaxID=57043 RepID=UPI002367A28D|nr:arylsulfatase [Microbacterium esteraromaticum]WDH79271.1 arylsulfatase [Microbacterium esteraromaticum]
MTGGRRPNVVLIVADQWRGDALSAAGHPVVRTPVLDELAARGVRFDRAYSATPTCVPARAALLTGQSQERHGLVGYVEGVDCTLAQPVTLPGVFRDAGYQTQAIGKMHVWPQRARLGFDDVQLHDGFLHHARREHGGHLEPIDDYVHWLRRQPGVSADEEYFDHGAGCNSVVTRPWDKAEHLHPTNWVTSTAGRFLERRDPTQPFFLYLSYHRPHPPYDPPAWALEQYLAAEPHAPVRGDWNGVWDAHRNDGGHQTSLGDMPDDVIRRARAGYYGAMAHVDLQIGRFLELLAQAGEAENTVVLFTSDHGEMLGDHDIYRKAVPYEGSARVPLIVADAPARAVGAATKRVSSALGELRDVMPTLLELAGIEVPDTVDGASLASIVTGTADDTAHRDWLHGEHVYWGQSLQWVTDGRYKYVWASGDGVEQLFDLVEDPDETTDLSHDESARDALLRCRAQLIAALQGRPEGFVRDGMLQTGVAVSAVLPHLHEVLDAG